MKTSRAVGSGREAEVEVKAGPLEEAVTRDMETEAGGTEAQGINQDLRYPLCSTNVVEHLIIL
jgi:hypothetical protein